MFMDMSDCNVGDNVKIHPGTDAFMLGFRYGQIAKVGRKWVHVETSTIRGDKVIPRTFKFAPQNLLPNEMPG